MKPRLWILSLLVLAAVSGCAPFDTGVPETRAAPATSRNNTYPSPPTTTAPGETRRP